MKYVFFGTPRFAEIILGGLIEAGMPPAALVCNPDRPVGRKKIVTPPPTKMLAAKSGRAIEIVQPEKLDETFIGHVAALKPDLFIVAAYAKIIPKTVLAIPRLGTLGVHPSLLPKYRGASPIQSAILNGEKETGTTLYLMDEKMDHGKIVAQEKYVPSANDLGHLSYEDLEKNLAKLSAELLIKIIPDFTAKRSKEKAQDESEATYTKKFSATDGFVDEKELTLAEHGNTKNAERIVRMINAFTPEPGVWTEKSGKRVKLLAAMVQNGSLKLSKIQEEGGKPRTL